MAFSRPQVAQLAEVSLLVAIRDAHRRGQSWPDNVRAIRARLYDKFGSRHRVLAKIEVRPPFHSGTTSVEVARLKLENGSWNLYNPRTVCVASTTGPLPYLSEWVSERATAAGRERVRAGGCG